MIRRLAIPGRTAFLALFVATAVVCTIAVNVADAARGNPLSGRIPANQPVPLQYYGPGGGVNHLTNPSFDADADFNGAPDAWWLKSGVLTETLYYNSSPWAINGHVSGFIGTILSQDLDVSIPGGSVVTASAYIAKTFAPSNNQLGFSINYQDAGNNVYTAEIMRPSVVMSDGTYSEFTATLTLPPTATKVSRFFVTRNESGQYYLDSLALNIEPYTPVWTALKYGEYGYSFYSGVAAFGSNRVWLGGGYGGIVLHSADGGATWVTQTMPNTSSSVVDVGFADANNGWAIGSANRTFDGGTTWVTQTIPSDVWVSGIDVLDASRAWIAAYDYDSRGIVLSTTDGGTTWYSQTVSPFSLYAVDFVDANNGWAIGDNSTLLHTINGGTTWVTQTLPITSTPVYLRGLSFLDSSTGWLFGYIYADYGELGIILHTTNGGATWVPQPSGNANGWFSDGAMADALHGCAIGRGVYCTSDGGATWHTVPPTVSSNYMFMPSDITFSGGVGWAVGMPGLVLRYGTPAGSLGSIVGTARLQGRSNHAGTPVVVGSTVVTTVANGAFTATDLTSPVYTAVIARGGYLNRTITNIPVTAGQTTTVPQLRLRGGDVVQDGVVDIYDLVAVGGNFGTTAAIADITGDGAVNIFDLVLVGANFGRTAQINSFFDVFLE